MPLFGGKRDINLFSHFNRELINRIINVFVDIYKPAVQESDTNLYGESISKVWMSPVRVPCLISTEEQSSDYNDIGIADLKQIAKFSFLRDELEERDIFIEVGDVIHWNEYFWEVDFIINNNFHLKRNPETNKEMDDQWGWDVSFQCQAHMMRKNIPQLKETRSGNND